MPQLRARLKAITPDRDLMSEIGLRAFREQKLLVPRKTGNLGRSIGLGSITDVSVDTVAGANYATFVEFGTRAHEIVPRVKKALRFAVGQNRRLSGAPRKGAPVIFAKRVHHPGTKAQPFMLPGAERAAEHLEDIMVGLWNDAA